MPGVKIVGWQHILKNISVMTEFFMEHLYLSKERAEELAYLVVDEKVSIINVENMAEAEALANKLKGIWAYVEIIPEDG